MGSWVETPSAAGDSLTYLHKKNGSIENRESRQIPSYRFVEEWVCVCWMNEEREKGCIFLGGGEWPPSQITFHHHLIFNSTRRLHACLPLLCEYEYQIQLERHHDDYLQSTTKDPIDSFERNPFTRFFESWHRFATYCFYSLFVHSSSLRFLPFHSDHGGPPKLRPRARPNLRSQY